MSKPGGGVSASRRRSSSGLLQDEAASDAVLTPRPSSIPPSLPRTPRLGRAPSQESSLLDNRGASSEFLAHRSRAASLASSADVLTRQAVPERGDPYRKHRLVGFIIVHTLALCADFFALTDFLVTGVRAGCVSRLCFAAVLSVPLLISAGLCSHSAWRACTQHWGTCLPLSKLPRLAGLLLCIPLGLFQGIVCVLALEDYSARFDTAAPSDRREFLSTSVPNKFHCKAVNGLFEGFVAGSVVLYAYWGMDFPKDDTLIGSEWRGERSAMVLACFAMFLHSGLGLLELDACVSRTIARATRRGLASKTAHLVLRTSEVVMRVSVYIAFLVSCSRMPWRLIPIFLDFLITFVLVCVFGGAESSFWVRLLCTVPCFFANIFLFIDSPYKCRAARRLSWWLSARNLVVMLALPTLILTADPDWEELTDNFQGHSVVCGFCAVNIVAYWCLYMYFTCCQRRHRSLYVADPYTACEQGSVAALRTAIRGLTHSAAVGLNVNVADTDGNTPLMLAAGGGHANVCRTLLQEGADVGIRMFDVLRPWRRCWNIAARRQWTALHLAAHRGHTEVLRVLLEERPGHDLGSGNYATFQDAEGNTPLHVAAKAGKIESSRILTMQRPKWANVLNRNHERPVDVAASSDVQQVINEALPQAQDGLGRPPQSPDPNHFPARPSSAGSLPRLRSPISAGQHHPPQGFENQAQVAPSSGPGAGSGREEWMPVELPIDRSSKSSMWVAPGLCSYVISCSGGPLSHVFLANALPHHQEHALTQTLTTISDNSEDLRASLADADQLARLQTSLGHRTPQHQQQQHQHQQQQQQQHQHQPFGVDLEDLVPIDRSGETIARWMAAVGDMRMSSGPNSSGYRFTQIPPEAMIGEGSYGHVWLAKDHTQTWYAVKNIRRRRSQIGMVSVATRECEVADRIRLVPHPCLVRLFRVKNFADIGLYVLVMEYCPGGDLLTRIQRTKSEFRASRRPYQPPRPAHKWIGQVFLGLEHMHRRMDTLLRDLKPENVVLDRNGIAKLTDFGFGRFGIESSGIWSFGIPAGSPGYVAPEVLKHQEYDFRADLYSLGVLTWVVLTGGLVNRSDVTPPMGEMRHAADFDSHFKDAALLAQCIAEPELNRARKMKDQPREFVARLTHEDPTQRFTHEEIRAHRFFQVLAMPYYGAPLAEVEEWLRKASQPPLATAPSMAVAAAAAAAASAGSASAASAARSGGGGGVAPAG